MTSSIDRAYRIKLSLEDYRCTLALDRTRHFGRAAEALGITQPSLTARLRRIETSLGVRLFERGRGGVVATEAGAVFLEGARQILELAEDTASASSAAAAGQGQHLKVGFTQYAGHKVVSRCLAAFREKHALAHITLHEAQTAVLEEWLVARRLDVAFLHPPIHAEGISECLLDEVPVAAVDLSRGTGATAVVRYPRAEAPVFMGTLARLPLELAGERETLAEADSILGAVALSAAGYGSAILPYDYAHPEVASAKAIGRSDIADLSLATSLAWRSLDRREIVRAFVACCRALAPAD